MRNRLPDRYRTARPADDLFAEAPPVRREEHVDTVAVAALLGCCVERVEVLCLRRVLVATLAAELRAAREANRWLRYGIWTAAAFAAASFVAQVLPLVLPVVGGH